MKPDGHVASATVVYRSVYPFTLSFKLGPGPSSVRTVTKYLPDDVFEAAAPM